MAQTQLYNREYILDYKQATLSKGSFSKVKLKSGIVLVSHCCMLLINAPLFLEDV